MARRPRTHSPGAIYHVMVRGNKKKEIFLDNSDYKKYLFICKDCLSCMPFSVLAYSFMYNHGHFAIEVGEYPLSQLMQLIQQRYTQYFNKKYETVGHVFQGRYKALLVNRQEYLLELINYIHQNPKKAGIVNSLEDYPWTGHYELATNSIFILDYKKMLSYFHADLKTARIQYFAYLKENDISNLSEEYYYKSTECEEKAGKARISNTSTDLLQLLQSIAEILNISPEIIKSNSRQRDAAYARKIFIYVARHIKQVPGIQVAAFLNVTPEYVSKMYQELLFRQEYNLVLKKVEEELAKVLLV